MQLKSFREEKKKIYFILDFSTSLNSVSYICVYIFFKKAVKGHFLSPNGSSLSWPQGGAWILIFR